LKITVNLDDRTHQALVRWTAHRAPNIGAPMVSEAELITAMIITTCRYADISDAVCSQIRHQRAARQERGRG
jgi:hypothetical protein